MKIAISQHGHFALSRAAWLRFSPQPPPPYAELGVRLKPDNPLRFHPLLIAIIEAMGDEAAGPFCRLKVIEVPGGIEEYPRLAVGTYDDHGEFVYEKGRSWDRSWE